MLKEEQNYLQTMLFIKQNEYSKSGDESICCAVMITVKMK